MISFSLYPKFAKYLTKTTVVVVSLVLVGLLGGVIVFAQIQERHNKTPKTALKSPQSSNEVSETLSSTQNGSENTSGISSSKNSANTASPNDKKSDSTSNTEVKKSESNTGTNSNTTTPISSPPPSVPVVPSYSLGAIFSGDYHNAAAPGNLTTSTSAGFTTLIEEASNRLQLVSSPKRRGNYSVKVTVNQNDNDHNGTTDRTEMSAVGTTWGPGEEFWMATSIYLDPSFTYPTGWAVCDQLYGQSGGQSSGSPPFAIEISSGGAFLIDVRGGSKVNAYASAPKSTAYWMADATKGTWHDFLFHFKLSKGSDGLIEAWHRVSGSSFSSLPNATDNGVNVLTVAGIDQRVYQEVGLYRSTTLNTGILFNNGVWVRDTRADAETFFN